MYSLLAFNNLVEIPSYPHEFFVVIDFIIADISCVDKFVNVKEEEGCLLFWLRPPFTFFNLSSLFGVLPVVTLVSLKEK